MACKHQYAFDEFIGNPITESSYSCAIVEHCIKCTKKRRRTSTYDEHKARIESMSCKRCGAYEVHSENESSYRMCFERLRDRVEDLESRIDNAKINL